jgi:hypothetical protein
MADGFLGEHGHGGSRHRRSNEEDSTIPDYQKQNLANCEDRTADALSGQVARAFSPDRMTSSLPVRTGLNRHRGMKLLESYTNDINMITACFLSEAKQSRLSRCWTLSLDRFALLAMTDSPRLRLA